MDSHSLMVWTKAAGVRAAKTFAQTLLAVILMGDQMMSIVDVGWLDALGVAALASVLSILTSVAGLPEAPTDGSSSGNTHPRQV